MHVAKHNKSENDASRIKIDYSGVMLQIVASLTDASWGIIYNSKMFIIQATGAKSVILLAPGTNIIKILLYITAVILTLLFSSLKYHGK